MGMPGLIAHAAATTTQTGAAPPTAAATGADPTDPAAAAAIGATTGKFLLLGLCPIYLDDLRVIVFV